MKSTAVPLNHALSCFDEGVATSNEIDSSSAFCSPPQPIRPAQDKTNEP